MKKNVGLILGLLGVLVLIYFTYTLLNNKKELQDKLAGSDKKIVVIDGKKRLGKTERIKFAIKDTNNVDKIVITDPLGGQVVLSRKNDHLWMAQNMVYDQKKWQAKNEPYRTRQDAIDIILKTFKNIELKEWVPSTAQKNIMKNMMVSNKQVDIYKNGKLHKVWYIGNATQDHYGTYMLLEKEGIQSPEVVVMTAKGFNGHLTSRFFTEDDEWLHRGLWQVKPHEISKIELESYESPQESFVLEYKPENNFVLTNFQGNRAPIKDTVRVRDFMLGFKRLFFEQKTQRLNDAQIDSVKNSPRYIRIKTYFTDGSEQELISHKIKEAPGATNMAGQPIEYNPDRLYAFVDGKGIYIIQYHNFGTVFKSLSYLSGEFGDGL